MITVAVSVQNGLLKVPMDIGDKNNFNKLNEAYGEYVKKYEGEDYEFSISPEPEKLIFDILNRDKYMQFEFIAIFKSYFSHGRFNLIHRGNN
jgi:hypothetical protein